MFGGLFDRTGSIDDLSRAIDLAQNVVEATPEYHPQRPARLGTLAKHPWPAI